MCPGCGRPISDCGCHRAASPPAGDGVVRIRREKAGRKGKCVTVVTGIPLDPGGMRLLAKELKQKCGTGGTVKEDLIEIQGDHRDRLAEELKERGYRVNVADGRFGGS